MKNFSEHFDLRISSHAHIDFVDVQLETDTKLFLDPDLIECGGDEFSRWCAHVTGSFFDAVFGCCRCGDMRGLAAILNHSREPNETHLGYSVDKPMGRGASVNILFPIFARLMSEGLFDDGTIQSINDVRILARNFDEDRMSDLLTNVLREQLHAFTTAQCEHWGIPLDGTYSGWCWEEQTGEWVKRRWSCPVVDGRPILLVPKRFVSVRYRYGTENYIRRYLLKYRQRYHLNHNTPECHRRELRDGRLKITPPTQREIRRKELRGVSIKNHAVQFARENPQTLREFEEMRRKLFLEQDLTLSDAQLDMLLYPERYKHV